MDFSASSRNVALAAARRTLELERDGLAALLTALDGDLGELVSRAVATIRAATGRVIVTGMGKSGHVGRKIAATMTSTGTPAHFVHPAEASHGDLGMIQEQDVVIALSWSGEAPELTDIVAYTRRFKVPLIAITSRLGSALGRMADVPLVLPNMPEACPNGLAPTTSTTMQMAIGDVLAVALLSLRGFTAHDFRQFHPGGKLGSQLRSARDLMHEGLAVPIVRESATMSEAIMEMTGKRFGITAVVDSEGLLSGVVTDGDLRRAFDRAGFADHRVSDIMTRNPRSIGPDMVASQVLAEMNKAAITTLFVAEGQRPIGVINIHDLLRAGVA